MLRIGLMVYGMGHAVVMTSVTVWASLQRPLWSNAQLMTEPWFWATLWDAYLGFLIFYGWVFRNEKNWGSRILWGVLIAGLGNIAMGLYVSIRAYRLNTVTWRTFLLGVQNE